MVQPADMLNIEDMQSQIIEVAVNALANPVDAHSSNMYTHLMVQICCAVFQMQHYDD